MMSGDFARILRRLNPKLRVVWGPNLLAGLYFQMEDGHYEHVCGVDKNYVPAYASFDDGGHMLHSGYRRVVWILLECKLTTPHTVKSIWPGFFDSRACGRDRWTGGIEGDPIGNLMARYANAAPKGMVKDPNTGEIVEGSLLSKDQILDLSSRIHAKDSDAQRQEREEEKWFLEKWKANGGGIADKPKV